MVDEKEILKQYSYKATSNLVLEQDRRRNKDKDVGVSALQTSSLPGRMGDKVNRSGEKSEELQQRLQKIKERSEAAARRKARSEANDTGVLNDPLDNVDADVVDIAEELEIGESGSTYVPSTAVSQRAFEALMAFITSKLGDQPQELLRGVADEVLSLLKDNLLMELDRKKHIEQVVGSMNSDEFSRLSFMGRQITDYTQIDEAAPGKPGDGDGDALAADVGVAVVYDADEDVGDDDDDSGDAVGEVVEIDEPDLNDGVNTLAADDTNATLDSSQFDPHQTEAWLQGQLIKFYSDPVECHRIVESVFTILSSNEDERTCENELVQLLQFDKFELLGMFLENRSSIVWGIKFARTESPEDLKKLRMEMENDESAQSLVGVLFPESRTRNPGQGIGQKSSTATGKQDGEDEERNTRPHKFGRRKPKFALRTIDLEGLSFQKGGRTTAIRECQLPEGSEHIENKDYEEWHLPATRAINTGSASTVSISHLPEWAQPAFPGTRQLNRVQSTAYPCAFESDENMLLSAPTGAGKTNVAMLTILRAVKDIVPDEDEHLLTSGKADLSSLKVVYVAPMKALVSEVVENLGRRLSSLGLNVQELTGDVGLSRREIDKTHVIVTTPEKWDIITRKSAERSFTRLVRLLIVDEIHLLHDERGPVLEAIVGRTLRDAKLMGSRTRVIGLSATLPNYKDVAAFLRVHPSSGLFYFGTEHRPCPLQQCYVGITSKRALKRFQLMNEITYEKVMAQLDSSNQTIVFVHSRKETAATGQYLIDKAINDEVIDKFLKPQSGSFEIIQSELPNITGKDLSSLLEHGIAIHHAGMTRSDRELVERLFEAGHVKVLLSTATLAWGVNLPAHAVIIKGTQVYAPEHGRWVQLSSMDVMQMMGRAGRPQFDTFGEGTIITTKADVLYYLSLLNNQLPIESQMVARLVDMLNAEIANGSVSSIVEGANWLSFTYLYVRMLRNPILYGIGADEREADGTLERRKAELIHSAALELHDAGLIQYNRKSGELVGTDVGKVAADFYVGYQSMALYLERMKSCNSDIDLLHIFSSSGEFKYMRVRDEEKLELSRLSERVPIPVKEGLDEPTAKINVLLQAFISTLSLDGLALRADMVYVTQSAARLTKALVHIALQMKNAALFEKCITLSKCVTAHQWSSQSPLRQFQRKLGKDVVRKIERKDFPFERYYDLNVSEMGELLKNPNIGRTVHRLVYSLPRLEMDARVRPLSATSIEVELTLLPDFRYDRSVHGAGELFWIIIEDADSEQLLHVEPFFLKGSLAGSEHFLQFVLPLSIPSPPQYFIRCVSDRWIVPETVLPISFRGLVLPDKFTPHTKIMDADPMSVELAFSPWLKPSESTEEDDDIVLAQRETIANAWKYFSSGRSHFSPLQTQIFPSVFENDETVVIATLPDIERDVTAELCITRLFSQRPSSVAVWVVGKGLMAIDHKVRFVKQGIAEALNLNVGTFLSDRNEDMGLLRTPGSIVITTPEKWDIFSRRRREKRVSKIFKKIGLVILDDIHTLSEAGGNGAAYEIVASRLRYIAADAKENEEPSFRIVALSNPIANAREIGEWLGCTPSSVFSFHPRDVCKDFKFEVVSGTFRGGLRDSRAVMLCKPVYNTIRKHIGEKHQVLIYVSDRDVCSDLAHELISLMPKTNIDNDLTDEGLASQAESIQNIDLLECVINGIGLLHDDIHESDANVVTALFRSKELRIVIMTANSCWENFKLDARLMIIAGTECHQEGAALTRRKEYSRSDLMKMMFGMRDSSSSVGKRVIVIMTDHITKEFYKNQCLEPAAVESQLSFWLADHLNSEIASGVIESKQDAVDYLTWSFFYRRLPKNANYYGMKGVTHIDVSNHLSELVERSLSDLEASKCVATEGDDDVALGPLNLGIIASHYYLRHATVELFSSSISGSTNLKRVLDIISLASEFENVAVRSVDEEEALREMGARARIGLETSSGPVSYSNTYVKVHLLLQAHMNRELLPGQLGEDQKHVVKLCVGLLRAMVDVISSGGWLKPAIAAIELCQMLIQAVWDSDSSLMQLPFVDRERAGLLKEKFNVSDILDFIDMEDDARNEALQGLSHQQISDISTACQQFPFIDDMEVVHISEQVDKNDGGGDDENGGELRTTRIVVAVKRTEDEDEDEDESEAAPTKPKVPLVSAPRFMETREEGWWIIVGDEEANSVFTVKHFVLKKETKVKLEFTSPSKPGKHSLKVYLMSDSYIDCDQEETFEVVVGSTNGEGESGNSGQS